MGRIQSRKLSTINLYKFDFMKMQEAGLEYTGNPWANNEKTGENRRSFVGSVNLFQLGRKSFLGCLDDDCGDLVGIPVGGGSAIL